MFRCGSHVGLSSPNHCTRTSRDLSGFRKCFRILSTSQASPDVFFVATSCGVTENRCSFGGLNGTGAGVVRSSYAFHYGLAMNDGSYGPDFEDRVYNFGNVTELGLSVSGRIFKGIRRIQEKRTSNYWAIVVDAKAFVKIVLGARLDLDESVPGAPDGGLQTLREVCSTISGD